MMWFFKQISLFLGIILCIILSVAFFVLLERQTLGNMQRRQGPNVIGFYGIFQAIADGVKLILKESIYPKSSNLVIFIFAPIFTFGLALSNWVVIPFGNGWAFADFNLGILYLFSISSLGVHSVVMAGWSSNSKYAFLGALRSGAQMISYEIALGLTLLSIVIFVGSLNLNDIIMAQHKIWFCIPLFPMFLIFLICMLAETNRHPFDLPEAEAELVSGYNVEYSAMGFALFFLAEYSNIILMSLLAAVLFFGGWHGFLDLSFDFQPYWVQWILINILPSVWFSLKILLFMFFFVIIRGALPRYRYDQLMRLGWKIFLPITLAFLVIVSSSSIFFLYF